MVRGRRCTQSVRLHYPEEEEQHELEERLPVTTSSVEADVSEPLIVREDAILVRGPPPISDSEPLIKKKIVHGVAMPNRPATACTFGKLMKETQDCNGQVEDTKNLGNVNTLVKMDPGRGGSHQTFKVRKVVYGLNRLDPLLQIISSEVEAFTICQHHKHVCEEPEASPGKKTCAVCSKTAQKTVNLKTSVALTLATERKVVVGEFVCLRCERSPSVNMDSFYDYMSEEHRLAKVDEEGGGDESLMDTDMQPGTSKPAVEYMEESDEEDDDPAFTLSQGSDTSQGTDYMVDFYMQRTEMFLRVIRETFKDMNLPAKSFQPEKYKSRKYKWTIQGRLQNLWVAQSKLLFPRSDPNVALDYMKRSFEAYEEMITQELYRNVLTIFMKNYSNKLMSLKFVHHFTTVFLNHKKHSSTSYWNICQHSTGLTQSNPYGT